jgi:5-(carboxyamino)imidazole ribonucleotide synthase
VPDPPPRAPTVAVLGGGQLGRMLATAGIPMGVRFRFLDPSPDAPAGAVGALVVGALGDERALDEVSEGADVVTYEWEGVPADAVRHLARRTAVRPGARPLEVAQDRIAEKTTCRELGIPTPAFAGVAVGADPAGAVAAVGGYPAVVKTCRGGYDGKGQRVVRELRDLDGIRDALGAVPLIVERWVPFEREVSILAVRALSGEVACWPLVENRHDGGILRVSRAPAPGTSPGVQARATAIAEQLVTELDHVGVLAVEMFETDGDLLVNELAPRVHNSGHWTIEGAETSQFENHVRAVLGLPLGATAARGASVMYNFVGELPARDAVLSVPGAHFHDYEKAPRPGRKVGHVTLTAPDPEELGRREARLQRLLGPRA